MAKDKTPRGEMHNVGGHQGVTLTEIPEQEPETPSSGKGEEGKAQAGQDDGQGSQAQLPPIPPPPPSLEPAISPSPPKMVNLRVHVEVGWVDLKVESSQATARAEEIVCRGVWQTVQNQRILHSPLTIHRVVVSE